MNTYPQARPDRYRFLVLVPHIEARKPLQAYSGELFAAGFLGAWSFPWVAPLAALSKPLTPAELKQAAALMRELCASHESGKFTSSGTSVTTCAATPTIKIFGPALNITLPDLTTIAGNKLLCQFNPLVAGAAVVQNDDCSAAPVPPTLSFRAAAVANMSFTSLDKSGYSWRWEIEKLYWLPKSTANLLTSSPKLSSY